MDQMQPLGKVCALSLDAVILLIKIPSGQDNNTNASSSDGFSSPTPLTAADIATLKLGRIVVPQAKTYPMPEKNFRNPLNHE